MRTWTVAAADGVRCARVKREINSLLTFETAPFFCVYPVHSSHVSLWNDVCWYTTQVASLTVWCKDRIWQIDTITLLLLNLSYFELTLWLNLHFENMLHIRNTQILSMKDKWTHIRHQFRFTPLCSDTVSSLRIILGFLWKIILFIKIKDVSLAGIFEISSKSILSLQKQIKS